MRRYDMTFKIDAIKLADEIGATKASKELDIPQSTLDTLGTPALRNAFTTGSWYTDVHSQKATV